jgi:Uma2 family endonuclease
VTLDTDDRHAAAGYAPPLVSWEEFLDWARGIEGRAEWVDGEIIELMPESLRNFDLIDFLIDLLKLHVRQHDLGRVYFLEILMRLERRPSGRMPDILFVANEHLDRRRGTFLDGPADLVVEVVSRDSETRDRRDKLSEYEAAGIPEYWLIDPRPGQQRFLPFALSATGRYEPIAPDAQGRVHSAAIPGFWLDPAWLWQEPLPDTLSLLKLILAKEAL